MERLLALLLALASGLAAGPLEDASADLARARRDSGLYVGEGVADAKDHGGDALKAWFKAREDARAALALAVQARIRSRVSQTITVSGGRSVESVQAESSSESDVNLRNIGYREYRGLPGPGQVTVLAFITKEDYRRMLAGLQQRAFHPENGVMLGVRFKDLAGLRGLLEASQAAQSAAPDLPQYANKGKATVGPAPAYLFPMIEAHWRDLYAGVGWHHNTLGVYAFDAAADQVYRHSQHTLNAFLYELGWDWAPWDRRLQPYFPLRLQAAHVELQSSSKSRSVSYPAWLYSATAGLGLRFWANEKVALEGAGLWSLPLNRAELSGLRLSPGKDAPAIDLGGFELLLRVRYSGF